MDQRVVFLLSLAAFTSAASLRATDPLLALIAGEFGVTAGKAGAVITGFALSYGVFHFFAVGSSSEGFILPFLFDGAGFKVV